MSQASAYTSPSDEASGLRGSYVGKFGLGVALIAVMLSIAGAHVYLNLAGGLDPAQRAGLLSGLLTILVSFLVLLSFVAITIGREMLDAMRVLTEHAREMERGDLDVTVDTNRSDELGELYRSFAAMRDALRSRIRRTERQNRKLRTDAEAHVEVMRDIADGDLSRRMDETSDNEVMAEMADEFNEMMDRLQRRREEYVGVMRGIADGDLSRRMNEEGDEAMMADLAVEFNEMMDDLETTVVQVRRFTDAVSTASNDLASQTEHAMQASKRVGDAACQVTGESDEVPMPPLLAEGERAVGGPALGAGADADADGDASATAGAELVVESDLAGELETGETVSSIEELAERMDRIDEVTEFITGVATETNMLALNAGIEASKVEEGAEGFEVVAREVKSLAEETRESAGEIEEIATEVRSGTGEAIASILRQQAALLLVMNQQAERLSTASSELQELTERLRVSSGVEVDADAVDLGGVTAAVTDDEPR